jgi:hypothetical protein
LAYAKNDNPNSFTRVAPTTLVVAGLVGQFARGDRIEPLICHNGGAIGALSKDSER